MNQDSPNVLTKTLAFSSVLEIATGLALLVAPALVVRLLVGGAETSEQMMLARFPGVALFALGIACWPNAQRSKPDTAAFRGMLVYNIAIALLLAYLYIAAHVGGVLLWPAAILHAVVGVVLIGSLRSAPRTPATGP